MRMIPSSGQLSLEPVLGTTEGEATEDSSTDDEVGQDEPPPPAP